MDDAMSSEVDAVLTGEQKAAPVENTEKVIEQENNPQQTAEAEQEAEAKRKADGVQKRINELTRKNYENLRAKEEAERKIAELSEKLEQIEKSPQKKPGSGAPKIEDYDFDLERHAEAVADYAKTQALEQLKSETEKTQTQQRLQNKFKEFQSRELEYAGKNEGYFDRAQSLNSLQPSIELLELVFESDIGPELTDHLAMHLDEAEELVRLPIGQAAKRLGQLEYKLKNKPKPVTKAPAPPQTVNGGSVLTKDESKMTDDEWYRHNAKKGR